MTISITTIVMLAVLALISLIMPVFLTFKFSKKFGVRKSSFLLGALAFIIASIIELVVLNLIFTVDMASNHPVYYNLAYLGVGCIMEGIARYIVLKNFMGSRNTMGDALIYGAGHGGLQAMSFGCGVIMGKLVSMIFVATMGLDGFLSKLGYSGAELEQYRKATIDLCNTPTSQHWFEGSYYVIGIFVQIALTILVYMGVRNKQLSLFIPFSIVLHFVYGLSFRLFSCGIITSPVLGSIISVIVGLVIITYCYSLYQKAEIYLKPANFTKTKRK